MKNSSWLVMITILCLFLGLLLSVQYKTQQSVSSSLDMQTEEDLVAILQELNNKRIDLTDQEAAMQSDLDALVAESDSETAAMTNLTKENTNLSIAAKTIAVQGPGITIFFENTDNLISSDLVDIVNELWVTGAEAITVNDIRINQYTRFSTVYVDGNQKSLALNGTSLTLPIKISAIGDGEALKTGMLFPGGIIDNLINAYDVNPNVTIEEQLVLPGIS